MRIFSIFRAQLSVAPSTLRRVTASLAIGVVMSAHGQNKLEPVVVTASRVAEPLGATLRDVSVVDGQALREAGVVDITDALRLLPGVELSVNGPGATPSIFLRGANSNQTLVLVDGQRISSSFSGLASLQHINIDQIERIEVLRGPAASLYGADAVGGVIQIFTRRDRGISVRAAVGEWRSSQASVNAGIGDAANGATVTLAQNASKGYNAIVNPNDFSFNPDFDGYRFNTVQLSGNFAPSQSVKLSLSGFQTRGNAQYDGSNKFDDRVRSTVSNIGGIAEIQATSAWLSTLRIGSGGEKSAFISAFPGSYQTHNDQLGWQNTLRMSSTLNLLSALEWRRESVSGSDVLPVTSRRTTSAVLSGDWSVDALRLNTSIRIDDSSQYGTRTTLNGGVGYRLTPELRVALNAGTSFKAPTFNDLYYPGYSNSNLKPERGQNVDLGLQWSSGASTASVTAYQNNVRDLILFQCDASFNCAPQNVVTARLQGLTVTGATRVGSFTLDGSLDFGDPKNTTTDKDLPRRARQHGAFKVSSDVFGITTGAEMLVSGKRYDNPGNSRVLPGYALFNLYASKVVWPGVRVGVRVENATDRDYQLAYGYATGGRRAWLTLAVDR